MGTVTHRLKTHPAAFYAVRDGLKPFEVRRNDRLFQSGDLVELFYWDPNGEEGQRDVDWNLDTVPAPITKRVGWILGGGQYGIEPGYVAFALERVDDVKAKADPIRKLMPPSARVLSPNALERPDLKELEQVKRSLIGGRVVRRLPTPPVLKTVKEICDDYSVTPALLSGKSRSACHVRPRQKLMFVLTNKHGWSSTEIGDLIGGRDHTTVLHGVKRHREIMEEEAEAERQVLLVPQSN